MVNVQTGSRCVPAGGRGLAGFVPLDDGPKACGLHSRNGPIGASPVAGMSWGQAAVAGTAASPIRAAGAAEATMPITSLAT